MGARPRASMSRPVVLTLVALSVLTLTSALPDSHDAVVPEDRGDQLTAVAAAQSDGFSPPTKAAIDLIAFMQMYSSMSTTQAIINLIAFLNNYICQGEEALCALIRYFRTTIHMYRGKLSLQLSTTKDTSLTQSWKHVPAFLKILQHKRAYWSELSKEERRTIAEAVQQATNCKDTSLTQNSKIHSKPRRLARRLVRCLVACLRKNCLTGV